MDAPGNRFPKMLLRFPAMTPDAAALQDGKYDTLVVGDEEAHDAALADGWHESATEARAAGLAATSGDNSKSDSDQEQHDETAPPTRAELEAKAKELGVNFRANTSDKALADRIAAALEP